MADRRDSYHVLIPYREPTYELRRTEGPKARPYSSEFTVMASCAEDAVEEAVRQFKARAMNSSVAWVRKIDHAGIRVQRLDSGP